MLDRRNVLDLIRAVKAFWEVLIYFWVRLAVFTVCQHGFMGNTLRGCQWDGFQVAHAQWACWLCGQLIPKTAHAHGTASGSSRKASASTGQGLSRAKCGHKYNFLVVGERPQGVDSLRSVWWYGLSCFLSVGFVFGGKALFLAAAVVVMVVVVIPEMAELINRSRIFTEG